jgi:single-strand DNA-binding protein
MIHSHILGRLGKDAETKTTSGGQTVTSFTVATDSGFGDKKQTHWVACALWGDRGAKIAQYLLKGSMVAVSGELKPREYTKQDGSLGFSLDLRVAELEFAGKSGNDNSGGGYQQPAAPAPRPAPQQRAQSYKADEDDIPF